MENKYICVFECEDLRGIPELKVIIFPDFIQGWEWVQKHKGEFNIIAFAETINF